MASNPALALRLQWWRSAGRVAELFSLGDFTIMPTKLTSPKDLAPGDYYEDCSYHPCLCMEVDICDEGRDAMISGVSLVDGTFPRGCSFVGCWPRKLSFEEAMRWKFLGPPDVELPPD